jgi:hypothetical protein
MKKTCLFFFTMLLGASSLIANSSGGLKEPFDFGDSRELYIDLVKKVVANTIYEDSSIYNWHEPGRNQFDSVARESGLDHPLVAHTMIGMKRLNNIHACLEDILKNGVPGDCIETGVWRGGATILMRAILKAFQNTDRKVWVADSFEGVPPPNVSQYPQDRGWNLNEMKHLAVSLETVKNNFRKYGLLDDQVVFLKGWFRDTLPTAPIQRLSLLRLDGDLYESTMDALKSLYPKVSVGGYVIIDDYGNIEPCRKAVTEYRSIHNITDAIISIDTGGGAYWKKTK